MKLLFALFGVIVVSSVFADDGAIVVERMTCADIQARISELSAEEEPDEIIIDELTKLKADYRRSCSRSARGRKSTAGSRVVVEEVSVIEPADSADATEENVSDEIFEPQQAVAKNDVVVEEVVTEVSTDDDAGDTEIDVATVTEEYIPTEDELLELELQNLDMGLCADGTEPNKFGCCGDELFKDLGNTVFACCPPDSEDCFPPIK